MSTLYLKGRLIEDLYKVKTDYDKQCAAIADQQAAIEFGVRAQEHLNKLQTQADSELVDLHTDYQAKLDKMRVSLEEKWVAENVQYTTGKSLDSVAGCKVYPKK